MAKTRFTLDEQDGLFKDRNGNVLGRITSVTVEYAPTAVLEAHDVVLRAALAERAENQCEHCGAVEGLQMHHKTYARLGHELLEDVELLCGQCHVAEHERLEAAGTPLRRPAAGDHRGELGKNSSGENTPDPSFGDGQGALLADPVDEVWGHYQTALERPKAQLTPKVRRWISDAIETVGVERCKRAIDGLAASEHHRQGGYVGIEYALRPKQNQTIESRVAMMESKAPDRTGSNGLPTVQELLATVPSEGREIVRNRMTDVLKMYESPEHEGIVRVGRDSEAKLREFAPNIEPVTGGDGRVKGWRRVHV